MKRPEELRQPVLTVAHARREALIEITRGGVERAIQRPPVPAEDVAGFLGDPRVDVDRLESALRRQPELEFGRANPHYIRVYRKLSLNGLTVPVSGSRSGIHGLLATAGH